MGKIEILAPAGSYKQGYAAIEAGCDAIYGGLKIGNARQRAENFSINEYSEMLEYCRSKNVKFYLTLNILLRTNELEEILNLLEKIELPDAVIVADLGLIVSILDRFPSLPIHASTQFGVSSLNDVLFLESIGVTRAVLSRELTLNEIKYIKDNSSIELEVFVFGTQCALFSGQCLWGGLVSENSGNRGKCNGMCRDFYKCKELIGQFMYPRDLEIGEHIKELECVGVCSAKIEGRLRDISEIENVIKNIRTEQFDNCYSSYLSGKLPVKGMFSAVNPRIRYSKEFSKSYTEHDMLYCNNAYVYGNAVADYSKYKYIKTVYNNPIVDGVNISLKLKYDKRVLKTISYINTFGEKNLIFFDNRGNELIEVNKLCMLIFNKLKYNVYELISEVPDLESVYVDIKAIDKFCDNVNEQYSQGYDTIQCNNNIYMNNSMVIQTDKVSDIINFSKKGYRYFIFEISCKEEFEVALSLNQDIIFRLPILDFDMKTDSIIKKLENRKIMITRNSHLTYISKYNFEYVLADYTVNCWNESQLLFLKKYGVSEVTISPELKMDYSVDFIGKFGLIANVIVAGKIPIGFTRGCFKELNICNHKCDSRFVMRNINKNYDIEIDCLAPFGFRTVYREGIDVAFSSEGEFRKRIVISNFSENMKKDMLDNNCIQIPKPNYLYRRNVR